MKIYDPKTKTGKGRGIEAYHEDVRKSNRLSAGVWPFNKIGQWVHGTKEVGSWKDYIDEDD